MFRNFLCWFVLICSVSAFEIKGLGKGDRVLDLLGLGMIIFLILLYITYQGKTFIKENFNVHILFLFIAVFISVIMADKVHNQQVGLTLYQQRSIYFLLFYFLLHYLMPEPKKLEKMILVIGFIYCIIYIIQKSIYPRLITDVQIFVDRGTIRIFMPGATIMVFGYFIAFQKLFEKFDWFTLSFLVFSIIAAFLFAGRQTLISLFLISFINILINKQIKNRLALIFSFVLVIAVVGYLMKDTINDMIALTFKHSHEGDRYIRIRAAKYFLFELPKNKLVYIFGNGVPTDRSAYGISMEKLSTIYGFYLSDIGLISSYFKFGIIFVITVLAVFFKIIFSKLDPKIKYVKNYIISVVLTMFTTILIFEESEGIVILCIIFYLIDYYRHKSKSSKVPELQIQVNNIPENNKKTLKVLHG